MKTARAHPVRALVGDFPAVERAGVAVRDLMQAGFGPDRVEVIAGDPELARDVGGRSYVVLGSILGAAIGVGFTVLVVIAGGPAMLQNPAGLAIGAVGVIGGLAFIGIVFGRSLVRRSPDSALFAAEVARGDALVTVACDGEACERAREVLVGAGAEDIREEESPGPA